MSCTAHCNSSANRRRIVGKTSTFFRTRLRFWKPTARAPAHVPAKWTPVRRQGHAPNSESSALGHWQAGIILRQRSRGRGRARHVAELGDLAALVERHLVGEAVED